MAYYDIKRVEQAKNKAEEKNHVSLSMEACTITVTTSLEKSAEARKISKRIDYSDIYNKSISGTFFGSPISDKMFSAYRSFLGFYFSSFKVRKVKPKSEKIHRPMKQTELFS